jgi:hypothetical protein
MPEYCRFCIYIAITKYRFSFFFHSGVANPVSVFNILGDQPLNENQVIWLAKGQASRREAAPPFQFFSLPYQTHWARLDSPSPLREFAKPPP